MLKKIPISAFPITLKDLFFPLRLAEGKKSYSEALALELRNRLASGGIFPVNSGTAAAFMVLSALKNISKKEVVLPAYTASSLIAAIKSAGLVPVLCDISLDDFNIDLKLLPRVLSAQTICVIAPHMFGIPVEGTESLKQKCNGVFVIEDCAQALGSEINGKPVGIYADAAIFSFNRGKNLPTYTGGFFSINNPGLSRQLEEDYRNLSPEGLLFILSVACKLSALAIAVNPYIYGLLDFVISTFKERPPRMNFSVKKYTSFQARIALAFLKKLQYLSKRRFENGTYIMEGLKNIGGIKLPAFSKETRPAFNRFPVLFDDLKKMNMAIDRLSQAGVETSRMYYKPLHHIFDLGYKKEDFPRACYLAEHLLVLPVHPLLSGNDIKRIIRVISRI